MKRRWKIFWIVCGVMFLAGLICCVAADRVFGVTVTDIVAEFPHGVVIGPDIDDDDDDWDDDDDDWDDDDDDDDDWDDDDTDDEADQAAKTENHKNQSETDTKGSEKRRMLNGNGKAVYQGIKSIEGKIYAGRVYIKTADTDEITVESKNTHPKLGFQAYEEDGVLYLKTNSNGTKKNIGKGSITVTLPEKQTFEDIDLKLSAGELNADQLNADELDVKTGAGEVFVKNFSAKEAKFKCGAGQMTGTGDVTESMDVKCGVGETDLKLKGKQEDYNYDLKCGIGEIQCGGRSYSGLGREVQLDNQASKKMNVECGIGQITIDFVTEL